MVRRERYNGGRSWRDRFLKYKGKQEKKKKIKPIFVTEDALFKRIGSGDDHSTERFYDWGTMLSDHILDSNDEIPKMRSLKSLSAMKIAENHQLINHELLRNGNWSIWNTVWKYIVRWRRDDFKTFQTFADTFSKESGFLCHDDMRSYPSSRYKTLLSSTVPNSSKHRMERFFSNVKLSNIISTLNTSRFENFVILEISRDLNDDEYLELTNLSNLTALKISHGNDLKDTVINSWCSALKSSKWTNLQVLSLPKISQQSLLKLQKIASSSRLLYLEFDTGTTRFDIRTRWPGVNLSDWEIVLDKNILEQPLGLKTNALLRLHKITDHSILPGPSTILMDLNIVDKTFVDYGGVTSRTEYDMLWNLGEVKGCYLGLLLNKLPKPQVSRSVEKLNGPKRIKTNPKPKVSSVNSFFDL